MHSNRPPDFKSLSTDCTRLLVTVTRFPPAVHHFMHALLHRWPVALQSNWHGINSHRTKLPLMPCDGRRWDDCIISVDDPDGRGDSGSFLGSLRLDVPKRSPPRLQGARVRVSRELFKPLKLLFAWRIGCLYFLFFFFLNKQQRAFSKLGQC